MRRGTSSACVKRMHSSSQTPKNACSLEDTSFARSRDPCTSIVTQLSGAQASGGGAAIRYRGRANLGNQEEPAPGSDRTDACAARRVSPLSQERSCVTRSEKEGGHGHRPCEETRARVQRPYVVCSCRSRQAASWPRISSNAALSKRVAVRVNGGLGGAASGTKVSATVSIETMSGGRPSPK